ncbi:DICT sensory domain-containing protein [Lyngbya aestuarii]|uniref:DICT sensory domain-containing protein n=1 Tax=Lyngbya aestuarii TaxID=118322 RepID=UPI00403DCEA7
MSNPNSLLQDLLQELPHLCSQMYFKASLTALSHAMEDLVLAGSDSPLVIANFQQERFYRQEVHRYRQIGQRSNQVYVLAAPESESGFPVVSEPYETIPLGSKDGLAQEWHLVILGQQYTACLVCREKLTLDSPMEQARQFEGFWTFESSVSKTVARLLLSRIAVYRPELASKVEKAWQDYALTAEAPQQALIPLTQLVDAGVFAHRLITYLQASQYQLLDAYQAITNQERKERLVNAITTAIRNSLQPQEVLAAAVQELGQTFENCRCLLYRCGPSDQQVEIQYEFVPPRLSSLKGKTWSLANNPLIQVALAQERAIAIADVNKAPNLQKNTALKASIKKASIRSWLLVPIRHQGTLLGMLELHYGGSEPYQWGQDDISLVEAIATQAGVALNQAQAYTDLAALNSQLEVLERTRSNLIAIVGHELRTPLSTIQVCLESLESEPEMPTKFRQVMLETALNDAERLRKLIQDFLTLSRLESDQVNRTRESIQLQEAVDLALSGLKTSWLPQALPQIEIELSPELPTVQADGEGLVEVLSKLLDNACKFTGSDGQVTIQARLNQPKANLITKKDTRKLPQDNPPGNSMLEVIITDTGRGIEPSQLKAIFNYFYQEEDSLRRTVGGTGLGLVICRKIVQGMGGEIWADSAGRNLGSSFHFTVPVEQSEELQGRVLSHSQQ